jgi:excisionase family DNA binding protein
MVTDARRSQLLTVKETASRLGYHPRTVRRKIERGEIPAVQLGGKGSAVRVNERDLIKSGIVVDKVGVKHRRSSRTRLRRPCSRR